MGCSTNLSSRFKSYFSKAWLSRSTLGITKALSRQGYNNFKLEILGFCNPAMLREKEKSFISELNPVYNTRVKNKKQSIPGGER